MAAFGVRHLGLLICLEIHHFGCSQLQAAPGMLQAEEALCDSLPQLWLWLRAGGVLQGFMFPFDLGRLGNGIALWLGIRPYELFFYIFLPPILLDAAIRIDFFLFKKVSHHAVLKLFCPSSAADSIS